MLTVIVPAAATDMTTIEAVLLDLGQDAGTPLDLAIAAAIKQASAAICAWCGQPFALETVRETFHHATPATVLLTARQPVVDLMSVTLESGTIAPDQMEVDAVGMLYRLGPDGRRRPWPAGRVIAQYRAGYILPVSTGSALPHDPERTLPHDIERATITMVRGMVMAVGRDTSIKTDSVEGVGSVTYGLAGAAGAVSGDVEILLGPYRIRGIG